MIRTRRQLGSREREEYNAVRPVHYRFAIS